MRYLLLAVLGFMSCNLQAQSLCLDTPYNVVKGAVARLISCDPAGVGEYGYSLQISGKFLFVGVPGSSNGGEIYVYRYSNSIERWKLKQTFIYNFMGWHRIKIFREGQETPYDLDVNNGRVIYSGISKYNSRWANVFIHQYLGDSLLASAGLSPTGEGSVDRGFGTSVAISGDQVAVGYPNSNHRHTNNSGGVYWVN